MARAGMAAPDKNPAEGLNFGPVTAQIDIMFARDTAIGDKTPAKGAAPRLFRLLSGGPVPVPGTVTAV